MSWLGSLGSLGHTAPTPAWLGSREVVWQWGDLEALFPLAHRGFQMLLGQGPGQSWVLGMPGPPWLPQAVPGGNGASAVGPQVGLQLGPGLPQPSSTAEPKSPSQDTLLGLGGSVPWALGSLLNGAR